jgi:hypothetical protein
MMCNPFRGRDAFDVEFLCGTPDLGWPSVHPHARYSDAVAIVFSGSQREARSSPSSPRCRSRSFAYIVCRFRHAPSSAQSGTFYVAKRGTSHVAATHLPLPRYCSLGAWLSKYLFINGEQLTRATAFSSVHQTARIRNGRPLSATPEMTEYDPSSPMAIDLNSSTLNTSQRPVCLLSSKLASLGVTDSLYSKNINCDGLWGNVFVFQRNPTGSRLVHTESPQ